MLRMKRSMEIFLTSLHRTSRPPRMPWNIAMCTHADPHAHSHNLPPIFPDSHTSVITQAGTHDTHSKLVPLELSSTEAYVLHAHVPRHQPAPWSHTIKHTLTFRRCSHSLAISPSPHTGTQK